MQGFRPRQGLTPKRTKMKGKIKRIKRTIDPT